jgi:hypothetical protein
VFERHDAHPVVERGFLLVICQREQALLRRLERLIDVAHELGQARERRQRVGVIRNDRDHVAVTVDGLLDVPEAVPDLGHPERQLGALVRSGGAGDLELVEVRQLVPLLLLTIEALELPVDVRVRRVHGQDFFQGLTGAQWLSMRPSHKAAIM